MERSTPVNPSPGEQSLTPGEQRILILLEQVQLRMESLEKKLADQGMQLQGLQQAEGRLQRRWDFQHRQVLETLCARTDKLLAAIRERSGKQELSLSMLEHTASRTREELLQSRLALDTLQQDMHRVMMAALLWTDSHPDGRAVEVSPPLDVNPPG